MRMVPFLAILVPLGFFAISKTLKEFFGNSCDSEERPGGKDISSPKIQPSDLVVIVGNDSKESGQLLPIPPISGVKCDEDVDWLKEINFQYPSIDATFVESVDTEPQLPMADTAIKMENKMPCEDTKTDVQSSQMLCQPFDPIATVGYDESGQLLPVALPSDSMVKSTLDVKCEARPPIVSLQSSGPIEGVDSDLQTTCKVECAIQAVVYDKDLKKLSTLEVTAIFSRNCDEYFPFTMETCPAIASDVFTCRKLQCNDGERQLLTTPTMYSTTVPPMILRMYVQDRWVETCLEDILQLVKMSIASLLENSQDSVPRAWCMGITFKTQVVALSGDNFYCLKTLSASVKLMCLATKCHRNELHTEPLMVQGVSSIQVSSILECGAFIQMGTYGNRAFSVQQSARHVEFKGCSTLLSSNEKSKWLPITWDGLFNALAVTSFTSSNEHHVTLTTGKNYPPSMSTVMGEPVSFSGVLLSLLYRFFCLCFFIMMTILYYIVWAFFGIICCPYKLVHLTLRAFKSLFKRTSDMMHRHLFNTCESDLRQTGICHSESDEDDFQDCIETELHQTMIQNDISCDAPTQDSPTEDDSALDQHKEVLTSSVIFSSSAHDVTFDIPQEFSSAMSTSLEFLTDSQFGGLNTVDADSTVVAEPEISQKPNEVESIFEEEQSPGEKFPHKQKVGDFPPDSSHINGEKLDKADATAGGIITEEKWNERSGKTYSNVSPYSSVSPWSTLVTILSVSFFLCSFHYLSTILLLFCNTFRSIFFGIIPHNILDSVLNSYRFMFSRGQPPDSTATADVEVRGLSGGELEEASPSHEHGSAINGESVDEVEATAGAIVQNEHSWITYSNISPWLTLITIVSISFCLCLFHYLSTILLLFRSIFCGITFIPRNILDSVLNSYRFLFSQGQPPREQGQSPREQGQPPDSTATADVDVHDVSEGEFEEASPCQEHGSVLASPDVQPHPLAFPQEDEMSDYISVDEDVSTVDIVSECTTSWSESGAIFLYHHFMTFSTLLGRLLFVVLKRLVCFYCRLFCSLFFHGGNQASSMEPRPSTCTNLETEDEDQCLDQTMEDSECPAVHSSRYSFLPMLCPCCYIFYIVSRSFLNAVNSIFKVLYLRCTQ